MQPTRIPHNDTRFDMLAGRQHGLLSVGVTWGIGSEQELREAGAQHLVSTTEELIHLLSAWRATLPE